MVHRGPTLERHHIPLPTSPMLQTAGKAESWSDAIALLKRWHTVRLQAWHSSGALVPVLCLPPCGISTHTLYGCIQATIPFVGEFLSSLFPQASSSHTHFIFAFLLKWLTRAHESFYQLRTGGICSSPTAMAAGIHLPFSSFPQYPSSPQTFPRTCSSHPAALKVPLSQPWPLPCSSPAFPTPLSHTHSHSGADPSSI